MPRFTPRVSPKSSAFTINFFMRGPKRPSSSLIIARKLGREQGPVENFNGEVRLTHTRGRPRDRFELRDTRGRVRQLPPQRSQEKWHEESSRRRSRWEA